MGTEISARVVADSISPAGHRLTTVEWTAHRFVLPQVTRHRCFSWSVQSNRAVPVERVIAQVLEDPAIPLTWPSNRRGMVGGAELDAPVRAAARTAWRQAAANAARNAKVLARYGAHKQLVNRLLEPFQWVTAVMSGTDWDGFFAQRIHEGAQPEARCLAERIREAMTVSEPVETTHGDWHVPYVTGLDFIAELRDLLHVSAARCARTSYLGQSIRRDFADDLRLYTEVLKEHGHWSPMEHVATPAGEHLGLGYRGTTGNYTGWAQLRHLPQYR